MDKDKVVKKVTNKLAQSNNIYSKEDIALLAKKMKESDPKEMVSLWFEFQNKYKVTFDKLDEILIDKLKIIYQVDTKSDRHEKALDDLISDLKKRKTWT